MYKLEKIIKFFSMGAFGIGAITPVAKVTEHQIESVRNASIVEANPLEHKILDYFPSSAGQSKYQKRDFTVDFDGGNDNVYAIPKLNSDGVHAFDRNGKIILENRSSNFKSLQELQTAFSEWKAYNYPIKSEEGNRLWFVDRFTEQEGITYDFSINTIANDNHKLNEVGTFGIEEPTYIKVKKEKSINNHQPTFDKLGRFTEYNNTNLSEYNENAFRFSDKYVNNKTIGVARGSNELLVYGADAGETLNSVFEWSLEIDVKKIFRDALIPGQNQERQINIRCV